MSNFYRRSAKGFTLLEIIVSMAILSILILILATMVDSSTKLWRQSENRVDSYREARAALNLIANDLRSLCLLKEADPKKPDFFILNSEDGLPESVLPPSKASNIFFLTALSASDQKDNENKSDLCTVGYFLAYDSPTINQQRKSMNLYRFFRSSDKTFSILNNGKPLVGEYSTGPSGEEVLARNIVGFRVQGYIVDPKTGDVSEYPDSIGTPPSYLEIKLTALNNDTVRKLDSKEQLLDTSSTTFRREARTFTIHVDLNAARPQQ